MKRKPHNFKHGLRDTPEYQSWVNMVYRCNNVKAQGYKYYGGKGVSVCERWMDFTLFLKDMGMRPEGTSIDRIDVEGNYEPANCRWATHKEQANNTTFNHVVTYKDKALTVQQWGEALDIKPNTIVCRLSRGWTVAESLEFTSRAKKNNLTLNQKQLEQLVTAISSGVSQTEYGKRIGMHPSNVSRLYHRFK